MTRNDRVQATILLLRTRLDADLHPAPTHPVPTPSGFAEPVKCRACKGTGRMLGPRDRRHGCNRCKRGVERPHGCVPCLECVGGLVQSDDYLTARGKSELGVSGHDRCMTPDEAQRWERDATRDLALRAGHVDEAFASVSPARAAVEEALSAGRASCSPGQVGMWLSGDYPALDRALELTAARWAVVALRVRAAFLGDTTAARYSRLEPHERSHADLGVVVVSTFMPVSIRVPFWAVQVAGRERRLTVEELLAKGWKVGRVARELGLSEQRVKAVRAKLVPA